MSGGHSPDLVIETPGLRVAVVASQWHAEVMDGLVSGAQRAADLAGALVSLYRVPGAFELPLAAQAVARTGRFDCIVALGVVIQGGTPHFDYVCTAATEGLVRVGLDAHIPIGFGLLTVDNDDQARDRAGLENSKEDKGAEAMQAALSLALTLVDIARPANESLSTGFR